MSMHGLNHHDPPFDTVIDIATRHRASEISPVSSAPRPVGFISVFPREVTHSRRQVDRVIRGSLLYESAEMYMTTVARSAGRSSQVPTVMREGPISFTVVSPHESIPVRPPLLAVDILLSLLERDVHVPINRLELACLGWSVAAYVKSYR